MNRNLTRSMMVLGALATIASAFAAGETVVVKSLSPDTCFVNVTGNLYNQTIVNRYDLFWGKYKNNNMKFKPVTTTANLDGTAFRVGQLQWFNSINYDKTGTMKTNLQIGLDLGSAGSGTMAFEMNYAESSSTTGKNDKWTLPTTATGQALINGQLYNVKLAGFGNQNGYGTLNGNVWANSEMQYSTIDVYAQFEAVPEPASMAALGLGVLALARRRRSK